MLLFWPRSVYSYFAHSRRTSTASATFHLKFRSDSHDLISGFPLPTFDSQVHLLPASRNMSQEVNAAFSVLGEPNKRLKYDALRAQQFAAIALHRHAHPYPQRYRPLTYEDYHPAGGCCIGALRCLSTLFLNRNVTTCDALDTPILTQLFLRLLSVRLHRVEPHGFGPYVSGGKSFTRHSQAVG